MVNDTLSTKPPPQLGPQLNLPRSTNRYSALARPAAGDRELDTGAHCPAGIGRAGADKRRRGGVDVAERDAAGHVGHEPVGSVTDASAHGGKPGVAGRAAERAGDRGAGAPDVAPIDVALGAEHRLADLVIVADGAADEAAGKIERPDRSPARLAEAAAAVQSDIKSCPAVRSVSWRRLVVGRRSGREIGRRRRTRKRHQAGARKKHPLHLLDLHPQDRRIVFAIDFASSAQRPQ